MIASLVFSSAAAVAQWPASQIAIVTPLPLNSVPLTVTCFAFADGTALFNNAFTVRLRYTFFTFGCSSNCSSAAGVTPHYITGCDENDDALSYGNGFVLFWRAL